MPATRLAIDLSGGPIRVLEGAPGLPMRCGEAGISEQAMLNGRVHDPAAVGAALRQLLARTEINSTRAMVAASDSLATFRVLSFPSSATGADLEAGVTAQLPSHERFSVRRIEVSGTGDRLERLVYATAWDRDAVRRITEAIRHAGLDPAVVDLKSLCVARAVATPACVVIDLTTQPVEALLIDAHIPRVLYTFKLGEEDDLAGTLAAGLKPVFAFDRSRGAELGPEAPILVRSEQTLPHSVAQRLGQLTGHPVEPVPQPPRVDPGVRYGAFLTCIGLVLRRRT